MPLTEKGEKIKGAMQKEYGEKKGEQVFYASKNKGKITGVDKNSHIARDDYVPLKEGKDKDTIMKNINKLLEAGHSREAAVGIAQRKAFGDDAQHMGFTGEGATPVEKLVSQCDALEKRMDFWEKKQSMKKPEKVKPRNKDAMQPSNRHPKEIQRPK